MVIELPPIPRFGAMVDAMMSFTRVASPTAGADNNHKTLTKSVILESIHGLFRHLELLTVRRSFEVSRWHTINELLGGGNQARIERRGGSSGGHGSVDFKRSGATKFRRMEDRRRRRKRRKNIVGMALTR